MLFPVDHPKEINTSLEFWLTLHRHTEMLAADLVRKGPDAVREIEYIYFFIDNKLRLRGPDFGI